MNKIVNFHDVRDKNWLDEVLIYLKRKYYLTDAAGLESFLYKGEDFHNLCHITVDDGDITFYDIFYPLLKKHEIPATLFVSPQIIEEEGNFWFQEISGFDQNILKKTIASYFNIDLKMIIGYNSMHIFKTMTLGQIKDIIKIYRDHNKSDPQCCHNINLNQLREIYNDGLVAIGAHTSSHPILANEDNITCKNEIVGSINGLNRILGYSVKYFAYPNGIPDLDFGEREKEILRNSGCKLAFSTVHESIDKKHDPLSLPRYYISKGSVTSIRTKLILGRYWHAVKSIKSISEEKARAELKRILKLEEI